MEKDKISVLVAIYNIEKFIGQCVESIINQDYKNLEIILVDDNSTDNSGKICDEYAKQDKRVKVIHHKENTRLPGVRNDGMKAATGKYIIFVDGDDWLAKDHVSYLYKVITKEPDLDFGINLVNYTTRDTKEVPEKEIKFWTPEKTTAELLWPHISIGAWNKIYRRSFLEKNKLTFKPLFTAEGFRFITDTSQRVKKVAVGNKRIYYYRKNNTESATTKYDIRQPLAAIKAAEGIKADLLIKTKPVLRAVDHQIWVNHYWCVRQVVALGIKDQYRKEYNESRKYLQQNAFRIASYVKRPRTKIFTILLGIMPDTISRAINKREEKMLKKDVG